MKLPHFKCKKFTALVVEKLLTNGLCLEKANGHTRRKHVISLKRGTLCTTLSKCISALIGLDKEIALVITLDYPL